MEDIPINQQDKSNQPKRNIKIELSPWWIVGLLVVVIAAMIIMWKPWQVQGDRTVTVTGTTTVKASPDEYSFNPTWQFKDSDKSVALKEATAKSATVVSQIKKLGVADNKITTNLGSWDGYYYYDSASGQNTYNLSVSVVVANKELAQKVQDYLATTEPSGQVTPTATFSQQKQKQLETDARIAATKEARSKADDMAKNAGFKVGKVKSITDQAGGMSPISFSKGALASGMQAETSSTDSSISLQPGEDTIQYSVEATYYIH